MATIITYTDELHNSMVDALDSIAKQQGLKGKKLANVQVHFFQGVFAAIDSINGTKKSAIPPYLYFAVMRGEVIKKREKKDAEG